MLTRVAPHSQITFCSWIPGRLLHVKCACKHATLDLLCLYQWVRQEKDAERIETRRTHLWHKMERVFRQLPRRNLLVAVGDYNTPAASIPALVGRGLLPSVTRGTDERCLSLLQNNQLVLLNTWSRATARHAATFVSHNITSQIDFIAVRREAAADALVPEKQDPTTST